MTPTVILARLMQGTSRQPLALEGPLATGISPDDPASTLKLFALAAQAERFRLPPRPDSFDETAPVPDTRTMVPDAARPLMLRLVTGKGNPSDDPAAFALAVALDRLRLRPHPFDLPRLEAFVRKYSERLGQAAQAFVAGRAGSGEEQSWFEEEELDSENWTLATPTRKAAFIARLRASDAPGARILVEGQLPLEKADVRVRLVEALASGLEEADRDLLERLTGDRAPNVKQAATRLLTRLPGTSASQAQIDELLSRITASKAGMLRKRTVITLQLPVNVRSGPAVTEWLAANFGAVGSGQLAAALALSTVELLDAARDDDALVKGIGFAACTARDWDLLRRICDDHAPTLWTDFLQVGLSAFGVATPEERERWTAAALSRVAGSGAANAWTIAALQQLFEGSLPRTQARELFAAAVGRSGSGQELLTAATAVLPLDAMAEAKRELARQPQDVAGRAHLLAQTLFLLTEGPPDQ